MKAIMVMYDSLNRHMLEPYGCDWVHTTNFSRLAQHTVTFDSNYVGSMPCMPARRELHTGRYNFLHRGWGPLEPFDDSMPEILKNSGIYTHLVSDHQHYWEDGGCTYHTRYSSWEAVRGQEGDPWKAAPELIEPTAPIHELNKLRCQDAVNRQYICREEEMPQAQTFRGGLEFLERNWKCDNWFLQIETFDPHEPFFSQPRYKQHYAHSYDGPMADWPPYYYVTEGAQSVDHMKKEYAALVTMCDAYLGKVLDFMDAHDMWKDTMLIVNTDHGYLLGEHGWWSKTIMPVYNEIAHTPLFIWDPRTGVQGQRRASLTQTIDLPATLLEFFNRPLPPDMEGKPLRQVIERDEPVRDYALFGYHEMHLNITDGRWVYMKAPSDCRKEYFKEYTLMPTRMRRRFDPAELQGAALAEPFRFTKGCPVLQVEAKSSMSDPVNFGTRLYDTKVDPDQKQPLNDLEQEVRLANAMLELMEKNDCPIEFYRRFGFERGQKATAARLTALRTAEQQERVPQALNGRNWTQGGRNAFHALARFAPEDLLIQAVDQLSPETVLDADCVVQLATRLAPQKDKERLAYFVRLNSRCE